MQKAMKALLCIMFLISIATVSAGSVDFKPFRGCAVTASSDGERLALLWNNLLRIISLHDGYIDYMDFERNIGIRYVPGLGVNDAGVNKNVRYYTFVNPGSHWSPSIMVTYRVLDEPPHPDLSILSLILHKDINGPCLMKSEAELDMERYGWIVISKNESDVVLGRNSDSHDRITIKTTEKCVISLIVYGLKK